MIIRSANACSFFNIPIEIKKGRNDMERTYVFNFIFKMMAALGIFALIGTAGMSDLGNISNAQIFLQGTVSLILAWVGIWGAINCTKSIEAVKRRAIKANAHRRRNIKVPTNAA